MKAILSVIIIFLFGFGCALIRPYTTEPDRTLIHDEIVYFRSLVNLSHHDDASSFELTGYWSAGEPVLVMQGYLPPPSFKNLFLVMMTRDSMLIRDRVNNEDRLYLFDEEVWEQYHSLIDIAGYALYAGSTLDGRMRTRWREENAQAELRLTRVPLIRRVRYEYSFEAGNLQETRVAFPRDVGMFLHFHAHEKRVEMPDVARMMAISDSVALPVYQVTGDNFEEFLQDLIHAVDRSF